MFRIWLGVAALAASWVMGSDYLFPVHVISWLVVVGFGAVLLADGRWRLPGRRELLVSLALLHGPLLLGPWQVRTAALLMMVGIGVELLGSRRRRTAAGPHPGPLSQGEGPGGGAAGVSPVPGGLGELPAPTSDFRLPTSVGRGAFVAGAVMMAQWPAMVLYTWQTARSHGLPPPLPWLIAGVLRLTGVEAGASGTTIGIHASRQPLRLAATWEVLLDPATFCFFVGGLVVLGLIGYSRLPRGTRTAAWIGAVRWLALAVVLWLPLRFALIGTLLVHRTVRATWEWPLNVMDQMLSPWVLLGMLVPLAALCWRLVRLPSATGVSPVPGPHPEGEGTAGASPAAQGPTSNAPGPTCDIQRPTFPRYAAAVALAALAAVLATVAVRWVPVGAERQGRVMFVERHSHWEPTQRPYDTKWYGEPSGYNYAAVYRYLAQYYDMSRLLKDEAIDDETLGRCDVLIIKTPTSRYSADEIDAVERFVRGGGGLLLVGEHTNVFRSGAYLNDIARRFDITFRHDLLFGMEDPYIQDYAPPWVPHPVVANMPPMQFAVSGSINPGTSLGRAVIRDAGLWSLRPDYNTENYFPVPQHRPDMRFGAFIECWSTTAGGGRVLAFGDSTVWSNFTTFEPGKTELLRGMVNWLNRRSVFDAAWLSVTLRGVLWLGAIAAGLAASWLLWGYCDAWLTVVAAGAAGWTLASLAVAGYTHAAMTVPVRKPDAALKHVVIDRELSEVPMSRTGFIQGGGAGYGMIEQWIPRVGVHARRETGRAVFSGDALVVICPSRSVPPWYRKGLKRFVADGGDLMVIDSPANAGSTAASLLWPFGLSIEHGQAWQGTLTMADGWPGFRVEQALEVVGGGPVARLGELPVAAVTEHGRGRVIGVGFGPALNDESLGAQWDLEPDTALRARYEVLFQLTRLLVEGTPPRVPPGRAEAERPGL
ncbi:MAG: hypothetical protein ACOC46_01615 [Pirellulales bacterium]